MLPIQPIFRDPNGVVRFRGNVLARYLLEHGDIDVNLDRLASIDAPQEDREQMAQLAGVSLDEFKKLNYVSDETIGRVEAAVKKAGLAPK